MKTRSQQTVVVLTKKKSKDVVPSQDKAILKKKQSKLQQKNIRAKKVAMSQNVASNDLLEPIEPKKLTKRRSKAPSKSEEESKGFVLQKEGYGKPKPFTKHDTEEAKLTDWIDITIKELHEILKEERKNHKNVEEEEICPICRCELYDDIFKLKKDDIERKQQEQLSDPSSIDVVKFKDCLDHFYHKGCTQGMMAGKEYIK
jgi:hypothetical protein